MANVITLCRYTFSLCVDLLFTEVHDMRHCVTLWYVDAGQCSAPNGISSVLEEEPSLGRRES